MTKLGTWSTTAGNNNATPPDGWPEGQAPSTVNDCAREMMAQIRSVFNDLQYFDPANTPSYLSATSFSLGTADVVNFQVGRRLKLSDATTLYGTIDSVSATFVSVRLDSGVLTASLSAVALSILSPQNSALPYRGREARSVLINGNMEVWQRGAAFSPINNAVVYTADRYAWFQSASAAVNITRAERSAAASNVPTLQQSGAFFNSSLRISVSAIDAAIGAAEFASIVYRVEGYDWRTIAHKPNLLSFWANSNRSGIYCVALRNTTGSNSFVQNYTIDTVSTWMNFSVTVPEAPTAGTWDYSTGIGLIVTFTFAAGSTLQAGAGNWTATNVLATSSQVNFLASAGNVFMLTGLRLDEGTQASTPQVTLYADELARCQRYYWRGLPGLAANFPAYTANAIMSWPVSFPVNMRIAPTMNLSIPGITLVNLIGNPSVGVATPQGYRILSSASLGGTNANYLFAATDFIEADAEF